MAIFHASNKFSGEYIADLYETFVKIRKCIKNCVLMILIRLISFQIWINPSRVVRHWINPKRRQQRGDETEIARSKVKDESLIWSEIYKNNSLLKLVQILEYTVQ